MSSKLTDLAFSSNGLKIKSNQNGQKEKSRNGFSILRKLIYLLKILKIINKASIYKCKSCSGSGWEAIQTLNKNLDGNYVWYHGYCPTCNGEGFC